MYVCVCVCVCVCLPSIAHVQYDIRSLSRGI